MKMMRVVVVAVVVVIVVVIIISIWPGNFYVDQAGLEVMEISPVSALWSIRIKDMNHHAQLL